MPPRRPFIMQRKTKKQEAERTKSARVPVGQRKEIKGKQRKGEIHKRREKRQLDQEDSQREDAE